MLKIQELTTAVIDYLNGNDTEYAIMIDGKWGCGKTYFWNNNIVPEIKKDSIKNIYISLYGVKTTDEIEQKLLYQLLNLSANYNIKKSDTSSILAELPKYLDAISEKLDFGKSNFKPIAGLFTGITSQFILQQTLFNNNKKYVICFDDLERLSPDINIVKVLGYINRFVEHHQIKTVLICHENQIKSPEYETWKEKLIWYTYKLAPSITEVIDYFIKDYSEDTRNILAEHKKNIVDIQNKCNLENLRTIKVCLDTCKLIVDKLNQDIDFYDKLILLVFALTIEIKEGHLQEENIEILNRWIDEGYDYTYAYGVPKRQGENENQESSYLTKFLIKYYGNNVTSQPTSRAIFDYIVNGYFNQDNFQKDIDKIQNKIVTPKKLFLGEYYQLNNEEFTSVAEEYFEDLQNNKIRSPALLLRLCQALFYFSRKSLISQNYADISLIFIKSIKNLSKRNLLNYESLEDFANNHLLKESDFLQSNQYYQDVKKQAVSSNHQKHPDVLRQEASKLVEKLATDSDEFFLKVYKNYKYTQTPIFEYIDVYKLESTIWKLSNDELVSLNCFLKNRYDCQSVNQWYFSEKSNLQKLKNLLDSHIRQQDNNPQSLQCYLIIELKDEIEEVIKQIN